MLDKPIKTIGVHEVKVRLHAEVTVTVKINVARSTDEAERQARGENVIASAVEAERADADAQPRNWRRNRSPTIRRPRRIGAATRQTQSRASQGAQALIYGPPRLAGRCAGQAASAVQLDSRSASTTKIADDSGKAASRFRRVNKCRSESPPTCGPVSLNPPFLCRRPASHPAAPAPHNLEAEQALLGAILFDNRWPNACIARTRQAFFVDLLKRIRSTGSLVGPCGTQPGRD